MIKESQRDLIKNMTMERDIKKRVYGRRSVIKAKLKEFGKP